MKLPNYNEAVIDITKLRNYCLSSEHPIGKHKAIVFKKRLGIVSKDSEELKEIILKAIKNNEAKESYSDKFGSRFYVDFDLVRLNQTSKIRTLWITKRNENFPTFISCYIKK